MTWHNIYVGVCLDQTVSTSLILHVLCASMAYSTNTSADAPGYDVPHACYFKLEKSQLIL